MPEVERQPTTLLEDLVVAAVRGFDFVSSRLAVPWRWGKSNGVTHDAQADNPPATAPDGRRRRRVLLIESEPLARLILLDKLRGTGLEVDVAPNVSIALQKLRGSFPDAIFMELVPGGIHASEVIKEARRDPKFSTRPIYVYTCQSFNPAPASRGTVPGATRVFNKLSTNAETVVGELAADLLGAALAAARSAALPLDEAEAATLNDVPNILRTTVADLRGDFTALAEKAGDADGRSAKWKDVRGRVRSLVSCAAVAGARDLARHAAAVEAFLKELNPEPDQVADSNWRLIGSTGQVLEGLAANLKVDDATHTSELTAVIVDEKSESRTETTSSLLNAGFKATCFAKPAQALKHLGSRATDLLVVDTGLAESKGFVRKVCEHPLHENTPVLFIDRSGSHSASQALAISGAEFIMQPFTGPELGLRALNLVHGTRQPEEAAPAPQPGPFLPLEQAFLEEQGVVDQVNSPEIQQEQATEADWSAVQPKEDMNRQQSKPKLIEGLEDIPMIFCKKPANESATPETSEPVRAETSVPPASPSFEPPPALRAEVSPGAASAGLAAMPDIFTRSGSVPPTQSKQPVAAVEAPAPPQAAARTEADRAALVERICSNEMEIHRLGSRLELEGDLRHGLEEKLKEMTAANAELEGRLAAQTQSLEARASSSGVEAQLRDVAQAALKEEESRRQALEKELSQLRSEKEEDRRRLEAERQVAHEAQTRVDQLGKRAAESKNELERTRADLEKQKTERERLELEKRNTVAAKQAREESREGGPEMDELEHRLRESVAALAHITAELEKERGGRRRTEQRAAALASQLQDLHLQVSQHLESERSNQARMGELELQGREREEALVRVKADLEKEVADRQLAEEQIRSMSELSAQLQNNLSLYEEARRVFQTTQEELETRLQAGLKALSDTESRLQKETSERRRLNEALEEARRHLQEQSQQSAIDLSKVQSALQLADFERKRLESEVLRFRQASADSAHTGRVHLNSLRRQLREPANHVYESARQLLQAELGDEQKKQVQLLLENSLLLRSSLQETGSNSSESNRLEPEGPALVGSPRNRNA